jgi:glycosyltransferase involved in cell wall biosynthesis
LTPVSAPLVSIIVPVYNGERYLGEALHSALSQSYPTVEVIVVDDGSTDGTAAVALMYPAVRYIHQAHSGVATARNRGVSESRGVFLTFVDADDVIPSSKVKVQVEAFLADSNLGYVIGRQVPFDERAVQHADIVSGPWAPLGQRPLPPLAETTIMLRHDIFHEVGPYDEALRVGEDTDWRLRANEQQIPFAIIDDVVLLRRIHDSNLTGDPDAAREAFFKVLHARVKRKRRLG